MLNTAVIIFAIAAIGGLVLALHVLRDKFAPWPLSIAHALLGAGGLIVLLLAVLQGLGGPLLLWSLISFAIAALGGFFVASFHLRKRLPPKSVAIIHAGVAVAGFGLLLTALLG